MESPDTWDLLTSSLEVCRLKDPRQAWAFLTLCGLATDSADERGTFENIVRSVLAEGPVTGPSEAWRIGSAMQQAGMALEAGRTPDPGGRIALERWRAAEAWRAG